MNQNLALELPSLTDTDQYFFSADQVSSDQKKRISSAIAGAFSPDYLLFPQTVENLSEIIKFAHQNQQPVLICGNGTKLNWGKLVDPVKLVVSTQKLTKIIDHAVEDLTVTVDSGVKLADLQESLGKSRQFLPIDPSYPETATLGGIMATADAGSWRQRYGGIRDLVLGLSFVRADGAIAKAGGRVVKNVAGYDLMKLFTGSYGTLGVISQITFRTYPLPSLSTSIVITGESKNIESLTNTLRSASLTPSAMDLLSASVIEKLNLGKGMGLILRFQSIAESVESQLKQVENLARSLGLSIQTHQGDQEQNLWTKLNQIIAINPDYPSLTCKIGILPNQAVNFLSQWEKLTNNQGLGIIHANSGLGKLSLQQERMLNALLQGRTFCQTHQGFLTVLESPPYLKQQFEPWGYQGNSLDLMIKIKQQFDPQNIFNPGKLSNHKIFLSEN